LKQKRKEGGKIHQRAKREHRGQRSHSSERLRPKVRNDVRALSCDARRPQASESTTFNDPCVHADRISGRDTSRVENSRSQAKYHKR
jgi:hypothetical protein